MGKGIIEFIRAVLDILNAPNNDPIVMGLLIALFVVLISNVIMYLNFRARLKDKDGRIEDLVEQRNLFQKIVLEEKGIERKSTKHEKQLDVKERVVIEDKTHEKEPEAGG